MFKRALGAALVCAFAVPAAAAAKDKDGQRDTARVEHLATLPAPAGIGANFKGDHMFVTGTAGLYVYDISTPDDPQPVSTLPLPHYENEDVSIGGDRLLISGDGTLGGSVLTVVNIADPAAPKVERVIKMYTLGGPGHTATCIQDCKYAWVAGYESLWVLNLDEADQIPSNGILPGLQSGNTASKVEVGDMWMTQDAEGTAVPAIREFGWSTHDVQVDEAGYAWVVGGDGTVAFDVRPGQYPVPDKPYPQNLLEPRLVARTGPTALNDGDFFESDPENNADTNNDFIHHNSWRPDAKRFGTRSRGKKGGVAPGSLVLITEEDIWSRSGQGATPGGCETQGSFQTWQLQKLGSPGENESTVKQLDSWTTEFNEAIEGDETPDGHDVIPTNGQCSSHYFDEQDGIVATAWYQQGTRFLDVSNPRKIEQVGFFLPEGAMTWAAYWAPNDRNVLYVVDNVRGLDVLRFERGDLKRDEKRGRRTAVRASAAQLWTPKQGKAHPKFGYVCRLPRIAR